MMYAGSDLFNPCYPFFSEEQLPWRHGLARLMSSFRAFGKDRPFVLN
jgi:hypothetical protein